MQKINLQFTFLKVFFHSNLSFLSVVAALVLMYDSTGKAKDETNSPVWYSIILETNWDSTGTERL